MMLLPKELWEAFDELDSLDENEDGERYNVAYRKWKKLNDEFHKKLTESVPESFQII